MEDLHIVVSTIGSEVVLDSICVCVFLVMLGLPGSFINVSHLPADGYIRPDYEQFLLNVIDFR